MQFKQRFYKTWLFKAALALTLFGLLLAFAPSKSAASRLLVLTGDYTLPHYSLSGGSGVWASGGGYTLGGALSPHDGGFASGGGFQLAGGALSGTGMGGAMVYLPLVWR